MHLSTSNEKGGVKNKKSLKKKKIEEFKTYHKI